MPIQELSPSNTPRLFAGAALAFVFASCAAYPDSGSGSIPSAPSTNKPLFEPPHVRGVVVDGAGSAVRARVEVVKENGGSSSSVQKGSFSLPRPTSGTATLIATTEDGQIAWRTITADDDGPMTLVVDQPGAFLELELDRDESTRVAVFHGGIRLHDVTLRRDKLATFVVPVGDIKFGLTGVGTELREVSLAEGQRAHVRLN